MDVNQTGIITKKLQYNKETQTVEGSYGIFIEGKAILYLKDNQGKVMKEIVLENVNPLKKLKLYQKVSNLKQVKSISIIINDSRSNIHVLDAIEI